MTAMIDVIFLLLIFFVLTAQFSREEQFLPIRLPGQASAAQRLDVPTEPLPIYIALQDDLCRVDLRKDRQLTMTLAVSDPAASLPQFTQTVQAALEQEKRIVSDPVEIYCKDEVPWDVLVKLYNGLYSMGIEDITFVLKDPWNP